MIDIERGIMELFIINSFIIYLLRSSLLVAQDTVLNEEEVFPATMVPTNKGTWIWQVITGVLNSAQEEMQFTKTV